MLAMNAAKDSGRIRIGTHTHAVTLQANIMGWSGFLFYRLFFFFSLLGTPIDMAIQWNQTNGWMDTKRTFLIHKITATK